MDLTSGASAAAKLQAFLTKALLAGMLLAMAISFVKGGLSNILPPYAGGGPSTVDQRKQHVCDISVLVMTPFFYAGFDTHTAAGSGGRPDWRSAGYQYGTWRQAVLYDLYLFLRHHHTWTDFIRARFGIGLS